MRLALVAFFTVLAAAAAQAETFDSHYAPRVGQHSQIRLTKCTDSTQASQAPTHQCATFIYDEEVVSRTGDGFRIRYVATGVEGPGGPAALALLQRLPFDLNTDASGYPVSVQNRQELLEQLRQSLPQADPTALAATMRSYEQMDDASLARVVARDFIPLSQFQNTSATIGEMHSQATQLLFPLYPSAILSGSTDFQLDRVDRTSGIAYAHYETHYDPGSVGRALEAWRQSIIAQRAHSDPGENLQDANFQLTVRVDGEVDLTSGETRRAHSVRTVDATSNGQALHRVETSDIARTHAQ